MCGRDEQAACRHLTTVPTRRTHMAVMTERSADDTTIRPFTIEIPEAELEDLRARIAATRWPEKEGVEDASQGVQLATMQAIARYWATEYDWRKCEARLNAVPALHHRDRRAGHPLRPRSLQARGRAAADRLPRMARLVHRADEDRRSAHRPDGAWRQRVGRLPRGDPEHAGLRVLGQADRDRLGPDPHRARLGRADEAPRLRAVRGGGRRLWRARHRVHGRRPRRPRVPGAGAAGAAGIPHQLPRRVSA